MIDHYYYQPSDEDNSKDSSTKHPKHHKRHKNQEDIKDSASSESEDEKQKHPRSKHHLILRFTLAILAILIVITSLVAGSVYLYVKNVPLANDSGRTNILILGVDDTASLSDTIMLLSIDSSGTEPRAALLSIPRDLYVPIPGFGSAKINAAHAYGENNNYDGGGVALSIATIENIFDLKIHYHLSIDFEVFVDVIDSLGGVNVEVARDLNDPLYPDDRGGYNPLYIPAGEQHMDGELALKYARSRQTTNDFDRAFRQQQILVALKKAAVDLHPMNDIGTIKDLVKLASEIDGDLALPQALNIANTLRLIDSQNIPHYVLDTSNFLIPVTNETGSALVPASGNFLSIAEFIADIFNRQDVAEYPHQN